MRASLPRFLRIKPIPADQVPPNSIRLPPVQGNQPARKQEPDTLAKRLLRRAQESEEKTPGSWPQNLRIEEHVNKRNLFWKVSKSERDILRKALRES